MVAARYQYLGFHLIALTIELLKLGMWNFV
jgi:hypothetical protein